MQRVHADVAALPYVTLRLCITVVLNAQPYVYPAALLHVHSASLQRVVPVSGPMNPAKRHLEVAPDTNHSTSDDAIFPATPTPKCAQGDEDGDSPSMDDEALSDLMDLCDLDHDVLDGFQRLALILCLSHVHSSLSRIALATLGRVLVTSANPSNVWPTFSWAESGRPAS